MRTEDCLLTCRTLRSTPVWSLLALAALLPGGAAATAPSADDLWDISLGTVVTATSGIREGFAPTDMFGDTASSREAGNTVFSDGMPAAFTHYIEWQTVAPVTVGSVVLFAGGDGPTYFNEREFDRFVLKAKTEGALDFDLTLYDYSPPHPYPIADAAVDPLLITDIPPVSARSFRAEFTQYTAGRGYDGPRVVELDAFPPPPSGPSTNDLWDVRQGTVVVSTTGIRGGFAAADMFGDHASAMEPGNTVFSDDEPAGFVHSIEWQTVAPVAVGSFALYAGGDGPVYYNEREFDRFVLKAKPPGAADFNVILCDFTPPHPYPVVDAAQDPLLVKDITPITAQSFRAEFVQYTAGRGYDGPRVVELDAFPPATPPPPPFNLATNGSFELPPGIVTYRVFTAGTELPGWIVEQGTVEIVGPYWQAAEGLQSLDLNGIFEHIGTISHPVSTAPGQRYKIRFAYAGNPEGGPAVKTTRVFWDDSLLAEVSFDTTGHSVANMGWVYYEYEVTAASTSSRLKFQSTTPSFCGPALDDVSITLLDGPPPAFHDGIPDAWREQHFGPGYATDPRAAATADPDSDGANNYREFLDGTDPLNASSVKRMPLWVSTYAGSTRGAQDGFRTEARFNELYGMALDRAGRLWLPETRGIGWDQPGDGFHRIRLLDTQGMVSVLSGGEAGLVDGPLDQARFSGPFGVVFDSAGNAFVLDMFNHRIRKIDANGAVSTFAGSTRGYRDGPVAEAQFDVPHGIAIDAQDNLFIADWFNLRIRKITPQGEVTTFSGSTRGALDGPRLEATYDGPVDVIVSPGGVMYVSDWANGRIRRIDTNGEVSTFAAGLPYTETLSPASDGGVYCYVAGQRQLNRYSPNGELAWSWGAPEGSEDGPMGVARFGGRLTKVIELADGNLLVGDDARIRLITMGVPPLVTFNPAGGPFMNPIEVTLTTVVPSGVIRFTIDGSEPTAASPAYGSPVLLTASATLKARVFVNDTPVSDVAIAEFTRATGDQEAPAVTITSPTPGATDHEYVQLSGTVTDNVGVVAVWLERDGQPLTPLPLNDGQILGPLIRLHGGENRLRVIATDAAGNEGAAEVLVTWTPARILFVENPEARQEGRKVQVPIKLVSNGDVGGLTFVVRYNTDYLRPLDFDWIAAGESSLRQVNLDVAGEIRATFALMGTAVPAGTSTVATAVFRARSVPVTLSTELPLELVDVSDVAGNSIGFGNETRSGTAQIRVRRIIGDNNANQRLDTGDATAIQRLLAALDPMRDWDRTGNDLNQNAQLDSGDVVRVLRAVVGLDPQPVPAPGGKTGPGAPILGAKSDPGVAGSAVLSADRLRGQPGDQVTVQVRLQDVPVSISGAAFTLEYSTNALRLVDRQSHRLGGLVAGNTLAMWNAAPPQNDYRVQPGRVSLGLSSATAWPESNGVLAEFTFEVQPGQHARYCWPVRLSGVEITSAQGLDIAQLPDAQLLFIGRDPVRPNLQAPTVSASGDSVQLRLVGEPNVLYVIEASSDLKDWTPIGTLESPDGVLNFTDPAIAGSGQRFYRLRQE